MYMVSQATIAAATSILPLWEIGIASHLKDWLPEARMKEVPIKSQKRARWDGCSLPSHDWDSQSHSACRFWVPLVLLSVGSSRPENGPLLSRTQRIIPAPTHRLASKTGVCSQISQQNRDMGWSSSRLTGWLGGEMRKGDLGRHPK